MRTGILVTLVAAAAALSGQVTPVIVDVGAVVTDPNNFQKPSFATGMNNFGHVIGLWDTIPQTGFAMTNFGDWADNDLSIRPGGLLPFGINRFRQITGPSAQGSDSLLYRMHLPPATVIPGVTARAINADRAITGATSSTPSTAFLYTPVFGVMNLGTLPNGSRSVGNAINRSMQIAGSSEVLGGLNHAFLWTSGTGMQDIGALYGPEASEATAINRFGQVTGYVTKAGARTAFVYTPGAGIATLDPPGAIDSVGMSINAIGQVVGTMKLPGGESRPFLFTPGVGVVDLNSFSPFGTGYSLTNNPWTLRTVVAINDFGQIAGQGITTFGVDTQQLIHAYRIDMPLCSINISPSNATVPSGGASVPVQLQVGAGGCRWTAIPSDPWITVDQTGVSTSSGTLTISVAANPDSIARTGSVLIAGRMIPILQEGTNASQMFADVPPTHPFFDFINLIKLKGITYGCSATEFCPDKTITRGEAAVFIVRALIGDTFPDADRAYFVDVPPTHLFYRYIQKAGELRIFSSCGIEDDPTFCADRAVPRWEMALYLMNARFGNSSNLQFSVPDYFTDIGPFYRVDYIRPAVQKMRDLGITSGCSATQYCPDMIVTRGQAAVFIVRALLTPVGD